MKGGVKYLEMAPYGVWGEGSRWQEPAPISIKGCGGRIERVRENSLNVRGCRSTELFHRRIVIPLRGQQEILGRLPVYERAHGHSKEEGADLLVGRMKPVP